MPVPAERTPIRPARGTRAELEAAKAAGVLREGELCWFRDEQQLYIVECADPSAGAAGLVFTLIEGCCSVYTFAATPHADPEHGDRWTSDVDGRHYTYTVAGGQGFWAEWAT